MRSLPMLALAIYLLSASPSLAQVTYLSVDARLRAAGPTPDLVKHQHIESRTRILAPLDTGGITIPPAPGDDPNKPDRVELSVSNNAGSARHTFKGSVRYDNREDFENADGMIFSLNGYLTMDATATSGQRVQSFSCGHPRITPYAVAWVEFSLPARSQVRLSGTGHAMRTIGTFGTTGSGYAEFWMFVWRDNGAGELIFISGEAINNTGAEDQDIVELELPAGNYYLEAAVTSKAGAALNDPNPNAFSASGTSTANVTFSVFAHKIEADNPAPPAEPPAEDPPNPNPNNPAPAEPEAPKPAPRAGATVP